MDYSNLANINIRHDSFKFSPILAPDEGCKQQATVPMHIAGVCQWQKGLGFVRQKCQTCSLIIGAHLAVLVLNHRQERNGTKEHLPARQTPTARRGGPVDGECGRTKVVCRGWSSLPPSRDNQCPGLSPLHPDGSGCGVGRPGRAPSAGPSEPNRGPSLSRPPRKVSPRG